MHVWLTGRADLLRLFQRTLFKQADPVSGDVVWFLYTLLNTPPCERRYAWRGTTCRGEQERTERRCRQQLFVAQWIQHTSLVLWTRVRTPGGIETHRTSRKPLYAKEREREREREWDAVGGGSEREKERE